MRSEVIRADSVDAAAEQILDELKADTSTEGRSKGNVIYFDGWEGLGASAVAQRLAMGLRRFDKIIHIDCSKWESRRALQKAIAEQLELPAEVMEMFDRQDEDDYYGLDQGSRPGIAQVQRAMHRHIQNLNCRFLMIFHNGSSEEIDLASFGIPLSEYLDNKVLWTFQGRFRLYPRFKIHEALNKTDVFLSASNPDDRDPQHLWPVLVHREAAEVAQESSMMMDSALGIGTDQLAHSFIMHILKLCCIGHHFMVDYDLATHAVNYWICDGVLLHQLQQQRRGEEDDGADELWQAADTIKREMLLDVDYYKYNHEYFPSHLVRYTNNQGTGPPLEFLRIHSGAIPNADMFQDFDKLSVLKLSRRTFNFSSPPFVRCRNLRFLWLDNCHDDHDIITSSREEETNKIRCFGRLLVLHVLNTRCDQILSTPMLDLMAQLRELNVTGSHDSWDMDQLKGRLPNIRKLRVTESTISCGSGNDDLFQGKMEKMELLDFSGNKVVMSSGMKKSLSMVANKSLLVETIIIDMGCVGGLERISFRGCAKLKNVLLRGLFEELKSIDISGTTIKTLDLSAMVVHKLDEVRALDCDKLCAILWPDKETRRKYLSKLCIDTTMEGRRSSSLSVRYGSRAPTENDWYISVKDARILRSLVAFEVYFEDNNVRVHVEVSSPPSLADVGGSKEESRIIKSGVSWEQLGEVNHLQKRQQQPKITSSSTSTSVVVYTDVAALQKIMRSMTIEFCQGSSKNHHKIISVTMSNFVMY